VRPALPKSSNSTASVFSATVPKARVETWTAIRPREYAAKVTSRPAAPASESSLLTSSSHRVRTFLGTSRPSHLATSPSETGSNPFLNSMARAVADQRGESSAPRLAGFPAMAAKPRARVGEGPPRPSARASAEGICPSAGTASVARSPARTTEARRDAKGTPRNTLSSRQVGSRDSGARAGGMDILDTREVRVGS